MRSDLFSEVPCAKLWNGPKVYYKGHFCAEVPRFTEMSHGRARKTSVTCRVRVIAGVLYSSQLPGKGDALYLRARCSVSAGIFHAFSAYWGPDIPSLKLVPARISPEFSTHAVNTLQVSFSALTCNQCQLLHTGIVFWFSLCTGPGTAGSWLITGAPKQFHSMEEIFLKSSTNLGQFTEWFWGKASVRWNFTKHLINVFHANTWDQLSFCILHSA